VRPRAPIWWVGGKRHLIRQFGPLFPKKPWDLYIEPFLGSGALFLYLVSSLFFHLWPCGAVLIDKNPELMNFFTVVRDNLEELLADLRRHENTPEYFYRMRALNPEQLTPVQRASRFLYLNKTSYGGKGQSFGRIPKPRFLDEANLRLVSRALARPGVYLLQGDYKLALFWAGPGAFVYLDPPYHLLKAARNLYYTRAEAPLAALEDGFDENDQRRLAEVFRELDRRGCLVMLSNSDTPFIRELYAGYDMRVVYARYTINRGNSWARVPELVIRNYS